MDEFYARQYEWETKKTFSRIGLFLMLFFVICTVFQGVLMLLVSRFAPSFSGMAWVAWLITDIPLYLIAMPVFLLLMRLVPNTPPPLPDRLALSPARIVALWPFCLGVCYIMNLLSMLLSLPIILLSGDPAASNPVASIQSESSLLLNIIFGACVPAVGEELLFRALLYRKIGGYGEKVYVLVSALCFSLFHGNLPQMSYAFVIGGALAYVYTKTRKIRYCMLIHFGINFTSFAIAPILGETTAGSAALVLCVLGLIIFAIVYFILTRERARYSPGVLPPAGPRIALLNGGMISYFVVMGLMALITYLSPLMK